MSDNLELLKTRGKSELGRALNLERNAPGPEIDQDEDSCPAFGYLRGVRDRAFSIEFRLACGNSESFPYSWMGPAKYNPSAGVLLKFVGDLIYLVLVEGTNLNLPTGEGSSVSLYDRGILRHRVTWVQEMTRPEQERAGEGGVTIQHIRIVSHRPDEEPPAEAWLEPFRA